uniref:Chitin-binding type-2 domain-containing protein n=1 Tax=Lepeophtheirus salmonis TaxID=72036 RepID=A0A0K2USX9_LEPSM
MNKTIAIIGCLFLCLVSSDDPLNPPSGMTSIDMLMKAVPGTPGEDYPIYNEVPETSFNCNDKVDGGYYVDVEARCQSFHVCTRGGHHPNGGNLVAYSFLCPNGSLFNQQYFICDWWFNVDCSTLISFYYLNDELFTDRVQPTASNDFDEIRTKSQKLTSQSERNDRKNNAIEDFNTLNFAAYESNPGSSNGQKIGSTLTNIASSSKNEYNTNYPSNDNQRRPYDTKVIAQSPSSFNNNNKPFPGSLLKLESNREKISNNQFKSSLKSSSTTNAFQKKSFESKSNFRNNVNSEFERNINSKSKSRFVTQGESNIYFTTPNNKIENNPSTNFNQHEKSNPQQIENSNTKTAGRNNLGRFTKESKKNTSFQSKKNTSFQSKKNNFSFKEKSNSHSINQKQSSNPITQYTESTKYSNPFPSITSNRNSFEKITEGSNQIKSEKYGELNLNKVHSSSSELSRNQGFQSGNSQNLFDSDSELITSQQSFNSGRKVTQSAQRTKNSSQKYGVKINTISNPSFINSVKYVKLTDTRGTPTNQVNANSGSTIIGNERQNFIGSTYFKAPGTKVKLVNTLNDRQQTNGIDTNQLKFSNEKFFSTSAAFNAKNKFKSNGGSFSISSEKEEKSSSKSNFFKKTSSSTLKTVSPVIIKLNVTPKVNFVQFKKAKGASSSSYKSEKTKYSNQNPVKTFKSKTSIDTPGSTKSYKVDLKLINSFKADGISSLSRGNAHRTSINKNALSSKSDRITSSTFSPIRSSSFSTLSTSTTPRTKMVDSQKTSTNTFSSRGTTISFGKENRTFSSGQIFHVSKGADIHQPTVSTLKYENQKSSSSFTPSKLDGRSPSTVSQFITTTKSSSSTYSGSRDSLVTTPTAYKSTTAPTSTSTFHKQVLSSTQTPTRSSQENTRLQNELIPSNPPRASPLISQFAGSSFIPLFDDSPIETPSQLYGVPLAEPIVIKQKEPSIEIPSLLYGVPLAEPISTPSLLYGVPLAEPLSIPVKVPSKTYGPPLAEPIGFNNGYIVDEPPPPPPTL